TSTVTVNLTDNATCTASNGSDFTYPASITIPAGQSEGTDNVTINGDTDTEENEIACIEVVSVSNGVEDGTQQARLNILMDPPNGTAFINTGTTKATSNKPEIEIRWNKSGVTEQDSFNLYYGKSNTFENSLQINLHDNTTYEGVITINKENRTYYYHGGLDVGKYYYYLLTANNNAGFTTDNVTFHLSSAVQDFPKSTLNTDNDTALLVYYDFDNTTSSGLTNLSTIPSNPSDYDLISGGGAAIEFGESKFQNADSSTNEAAYLNSTGGYVYNDNFNSDNESLDNFTISMWVYPDQDMPTFASAFATGDDTTNNNFQISDNGSSGIIAITENKSQWLEAGTIAQDNWTHVTAVKYADNNTLVLYLNGVVGINNMLSCPDNTKDSCADNNSLTTFNTNWEKLKIGVNRVSQSPWKGYIDEVKVYNRPLNSTEVNNLYRCDNPGGYGTCR
ncbi:MAG: LamG-like jellyroll fold domain-containing protein, partial [Deltaproteobacteria bacterium]